MWILDLTEICEVRIHVLIYALWENKSKYEDQILK